MYPGSVKVDKAQNITDKIQIKETIDAQNYESLTGNVKIVITNIE